MKNKKIIILILILLVASIYFIPNIFSELNKYNVKTSTIKFIKAIEKKSSLGDGISDVKCIKNSKWNNFCKKYMSDIKEKSPDKAIIMINKKGKVKKGSKFLYNNYICEYDGKNIKKCIKDNKNMFFKYSLGQEVLYNPIENTKCNSGKYCYTWNIISIEGDELVLQLDHNLGKPIDWVNKGDYLSVNGSERDWNGNIETDKGPVTALRYLAKETENWNDGLLINYSYNTINKGVNYGTLSCVNGTCKNGSGDVIVENLRARLITGEEIKKLTRLAGADDYSLALKWTGASGKNYFFSNNEYVLGTIDSGRGDNSLSWLVVNTLDNESSGATKASKAVKGYWTMTPYITSRKVWHVESDGSIVVDYIDHINMEFGVRPVITIIKDKVN